MSLYMDLGASQVKRSLMGNYTQSPMRVLRHWQLCRLCRTITIFSMGIESQCKLTIHQSKRCWSHQTAKHARWWSGVYGKGSKKSIEQAEKINVLMPSHIALSFQLLKSEWWVVKFKFPLLTTPDKDIGHRPDPDTSSSNQTRPHSNMISEYVASGGHTSEQLAFVGHTGTIAQESLEGTDGPSHGELGTQNAAEGDQDLGLRISITSMPTNCPRTGL